LYTVKWKQGQVVSFSGEEYETRELRDILRVRKEATQQKGGEISLEDELSMIDEIVDDRFR